MIVGTTVPTIIVGTIISLVVVPTTYVWPNHITPKYLFRGCSLFQQPLLEQLFQQSLLQQLFQQQLLKHKIKMTGTLTTIFKIQVNISE